MFEKIKTDLRKRLCVLCDDVFVQVDPTPLTRATETPRLTITVTSHSLELITTVFVTMPAISTTDEVVDEAFARLRGSIASLVLHLAGKAHKGTAAQEAEHDNVIQIGPSAVKQMTDIMDNAMQSIYQATGIDQDWFKSIAAAESKRTEDHSGDALFYAMQRPKVPDSADLMDFPKANPCFFSTWNTETQSYVPLDAPIDDPEAPCHCLKCKSDRGEYTTEAQTLSFDVAVPGRPNNRTAGDFLMICASEYASATQSPPADLITACLALASRINLSPSSKVPTRAQWTHYLDVQARMARDAATLEAKAPINMPPTLTKTPAPGEMRH